MGGSLDLYQEQVDNITLSMSSGPDHKPRFSSLQLACLRAHPELPT